MSTAPQNPTPFIHVVNRIIEAHLPQTEPQSADFLKYPLETRLKLSLLQTDITDAQAKLETQHGLEQAHRDITVTLWGRLAYLAEQCRFRLETRQWIQVPSEIAIETAQVEVAITTAEGSHEEMLDEIRELNRTIRERRSDFDAIAAGRAAL